MSDVAPGPVGILVNPSSGRDVRRLAARAQQQTLESKRNQVARIAVGIAAAGAERVVVMQDPMRASTAALEHIGIDLEVEILDVGATLKAADTAEATRRMQALGCGAVVVLGGDGTNRVVTGAWPDAPLVPLSTGTNNVFPVLAEATMAGAAAGLVATGRVPLAQAARRAKIVHLETDEEQTLALIDAVRLEGDRVGNLMPFDPARLRDVVLTRAEPAAVGMSPIGGLLAPCSFDDDCAVHVRCTSHEGGGRPLLAPISPGLYQTVHVAEARRIELGEVVEIPGPGVIAFDGDREISLETGKTARAVVRRDGPWVIQVDRALRYAAEHSLYLDRGHFHDSHTEDTGPGCC